MEWVHQVLSLPSTSQSTFIRTEELPATPAQLVESWCVLLRDPESSRTDKKLVLKALRFCRLTEGYELILRDVTNLVLDDDANLRLQAAGTLLQYVSMASMVALKAIASHIVSTLSRSLLSIRPAFIISNRPPSSSIRFVTTSFRILNLVSTKVSSLPSDIVDIIATCISSWFHQGTFPNTLGTASPISLTRGRQGGIGGFEQPGQLAFGVMSAFAPQPHVSPKKRQPTARTPGTSGSRTSSIEREYTASDTESEGGDRDRRLDSAQIRLEALRTLQSLASNNPKSLQKHWHLFLSDSPYLRNRTTLVDLIDRDPSFDVRIAACAALEAMLVESTTYLAIAQDRPTTSSFTSLSTRIGEIVGELHLSLSSILTRPPTPSSDPTSTTLRIHVLQAASQLANCAPYGRMKRPLARSLAKAVMYNLDSKDLDIVLPALSALNEIIERYNSTSSKQPFEWDEVVARIRRVSLDVQNEEIETMLWRTSAGCVASKVEVDWSPELARLESDLHSQSSPKLATARTAFVTSLFLNNTSPLAKTTSPVDERLILLLRNCLDSPCAPCRLLACSTLTDPSLSTIPSFDPILLATRLVQDADCEVSQAACRVLGIRLREENPTSARFNEAFKVLSKRFVEDEEGGGDTCWAVANCFDALSNSEIDQEECIKLISRPMQSFEKSTSDERIRIGCLRILGSGLPHLEDISEETSCRISQVFEAALMLPSAKIRWNACTSLSTILNSSRLSIAVKQNVASASIFDRLSTLLLVDSSYKVRIHVVSALSHIVSTKLYREPTQQLLERVRRAKLELEERVERGQIVPKERRHVEVLLKKLDSFATSLTSLSS